MRILALDLGTHTGFAFGDTEKDLRVGTFQLATPKEVKAWGQSRLTRRQDPRVLRLFSEVNHLFHSDPFKAPDVIVFEDVQFSSYTQQCQLWSSLRAAVWVSAHYNGIGHIDCVPVTTLKKFACGSGNADKGLMENALAKQYPLLEKISSDDNQVDAIWLWLWAKKAFDKMKL